MGYITVLPFANKRLGFVLPKCQHMEFHSAFKKDVGVRGKPSWLSLKELQLGGWLSLIPLFFLPFFNFSVGESKERKREIRVSFLV